MLELLGECLALGRGGIKTHRSALQSEIYTKLLQPLMSASTHTIKKNKVTLLWYLVDRINLQTGRGGGHSILVADAGADTNADAVIAAAADTQRNTDKIQQQFKNMVTQSPPGFFFEDAGSGGSRLSKVGAGFYMGMAIKNGVSLDNMMGLVHDVLFLYLGCSPPMDILRSARAIRNTFEQTDTLLQAALTAEISTAVGMGMIIASDDTNKGKQEKKDIECYYQLPGGEARTKMLGIITTSKSPTLRVGHSLGYLY
ncbi:hypothetical protein B484DRAFT_400344 [Ochromonadaceae sp. CCMP2298]|nr:hypothetical protein B484DRAFT_400344 [Ochromonadaceae sp. CCMP2298]